MNGFEILEGYEPTARYLDDVQKAGDDNREALGFFRRAVYEQFARSSCLYVLIQRTASRPVYAGHLLFSCSFPRAHVRQIFIVVEHRRTGLAALLLSRLKDSLAKQGFISIYARVAEDLAEANAFWQRQHFYVQRVEQGGVTRNRKIVVRSHELPSPQLFPSSGLTGSNPLGLPTLTASDTPLFLVDLNVLFDVMPRRLRHTEAANLFRAERINSCRLAVSNETREELRRTAQPGRTDPMAAYIDIFPSFPLSEGDQTDSLLADLASAIFPDHRVLSDQDRSDLRHLATAIEHRVAGFITSDESILRAGPQIERTYGVLVTSPAAFSVEGGAAPESSAFELSESATISFAPVRGNDEATIRVLLSRLNLSRSAIASTWLPTATPGSMQRLAAWKDGVPIGYMIWNAGSPGSEATIARLVLDETQAEAQGAARVLLMQLLDQIRPIAPRHLQIELPAHQSIVRETAAAMGFLGGVGSNRLSKLLLGQVVTSGNWPAIRETLATKARLRLPEGFPEYRSADQQVQLLTPSGNRSHVSLEALETLLGPALFCLPGRPAVVTPIQRRYSEALIGHESQRSLLPSGTASTHHERQYLSNSRTLKHFARGTLILFYESLRDGGRGEVFAVARVREAYLRSRPDLVGNLQQSVLSEDTLDDIGSSSAKVVTVFDHIFHLPKPVSLATLRRLGCGGANDLITTKPISDEQLQGILAEAFPNE